MDFRADVFSSPSLDSQAFIIDYIFPNNLATLCGKSVKLSLVRLKKVWVSVSKPTVSKNLHCDAKIIKEIWRHNTYFSRDKLCVP